MSNELVRLAQETLSLTHIGIPGGFPAWSRAERLAEGVLALSRERDEWKEMEADRTKELQSACADLKTAEESRDFFANRLNEALGVLGYAVPGDTPEGRYRCGLCGPKDARLLDADHEWAQWAEKWWASLDTLSSVSSKLRAAEAERDALAEKLAIAREHIESGLRSHEPFGPNKRCLSCGLDGACCTPWNTGRAALAKMDAKP